MPKITLQGGVLHRAALREPRLAEQLVEVPTVVSQFFWRQFFAEQNIGIPVPSARGLLNGGGLQGLPSGQSPTARGADFLPGQSSKAFRAEEHHDLDDFFPGQSSSGRSSAPISGRWLFLGSDGLPLVMALTAAWIT